MSRLRIALVLPLVFVHAARADQAPRPVGFRKEIAPILVRNCLGCHDDKKASNGLNIATFAKLKRGGKGTGAEVLVPGDPQGSGLYACLLADATPRMPFKRVPLPDAQTALIGRWIKEGAKYDGPPDPATTLTSLVDPLADLPRIVPTSPTSDPVVHLAFETDGKTLAAAVGLEALPIDLAMGKIVAALGPHPGPTSFLRFSPDGKTLVVAGGRAGMFGSVDVWDVPSRTKRTQFRGHADAILSADLSGDGKTLVTAGYDRMVKLWDVATGKEIRELKEHTDAVHAVAFSPDGKLVASAGADRTVKLWRAADGFRVVSLSEATGEVYALAFAPDGRTLFAGGVDRSIRSWTLSGEKAETGKTTFAHDGPVLRLVAAGDRLYSTGEDRTIRVWDVATLRPIASWAKQSDWVQALAVEPGGRRVAVGRLDGSIDLLDAGTGVRSAALREAPKPKAPTIAAKEKPQLVRPASLNPPSPRGASRGRTVRVTLTGQGVGRAYRVLLPEPGLSAVVVPTPKPDPNRLEIDLTIAADARPGLHRVGVQTPLGTPSLQSFVVEARPEFAEKEPNDVTASAPPIVVPVVVVGTIDKSGDVDRFRFAAKAGRPLVLTTRAKGIGSDLAARLSIRDAAGVEVVSTQSTADLNDPVLTFSPEKDGEYVLEVADVDFGGSGNHFYRVDVSASPDVASVFPLGVEIGRSRFVRLEGVNLETANPVTLSAPADAIPGAIVGLPVASARFKAAVAVQGPQRVETEAGDDVAHASDVAAPGGISGRIDRDGDEDLHRFEAKRGRKLVVEIFGRRLGAPIDSVIEILDAKGNPVPRAVLRPVDQTTVAFRDHGSSQRSIRLTAWDRLAIGDHLLAGRELLKLTDLPRNPDDDAVFWGLGTPRISPGERIALLETTPEQHPMNQPMYKVEIHPPGATFPAGGVPPVTIHHRNDDGGPGFGKDSRLTFDPPADGTYYVRVEDVRGQGGPEYGYHLAIRDLRPDFTLATGTENPNIPRGGSTVVNVSVGRLDEFNGAVDVFVEGLPPGVTATSARIEPDAFAADILLSADESAPAFSPPTWRLRARAADDSAGLSEKTLDPGGPAAGWITVTPKADLAITPSVRSLAIRPGERVEMSLAVERGPAFAGRVPIDVRNLPLGVRVLHIGLNGVLVTEAQTSRSIFLYAEPWVKPMERPFYAVGRVEASGQPASSPPILLTIRPSAGAAAPVPHSKPGD